MSQALIVTTEQLTEVLTSVIASIPTANIPPEAERLEILARKKGLSTEEVAELYGLNVNTLRKHRTNRTGPSFSKDGSKVVYTHEAIRKYLDSRRQKTIDQP